MALPTLVKTYEVDPNNVGGITSTTEQDVRRTLFAMKEALTGGGSGEIATKPLLVHSSCDGSSQAGAADYWADYNDVVSGTGVHSWIVLESQGSVGWQICLDRDTSQNYLNGGLLFSQSGNFTGGDTSNRPTASDEVEMHGSSGNVIVGNQLLTSKVHAMMSTDGDVMLCAVYVADVLVIMWRVDVVQDPITGWAAGVHYWLQHTGSAGSNACIFITASQSANKRILVPGISIPTFLSYEAYGQTEEAFMTAQTGPSDWDGGNPMGPIGIWSELGGSAGRLGTLTDIWWGLTVRGEGDHYPASGTIYQFAQVGDMIIPWDSLVAMQTS